jgi:hypothetical protein
LVGGRGINIIHDRGIILRTHAIFSQTIAHLMRMVYYCEAQKLPSLLVKYSQIGTILARQERGSSPGNFIGYHSPVISVGRICLFSIRRFIESNAIKVI